MMRPIVRLFDDREQWLAARAGVLTSSRISRAFSKRQSTWHRLAMELLLEREAGTSENPMVNAQRWGCAWESEALRAFQLSTGVGLAPEGIYWIQPEADSRIGCTPDAIVLDDNWNMTAHVEVKCPFSADIFNGYKTKGMPGKYKHQVQANMWLMDVPMAYFVAYDPRGMSDEGEVVGDICVHEIKRDAAYIEELAQQVENFLAYFDEVAWWRSEQVA